MKKIVLIVCSFFMFLNMGCMSTSTFSSTSKTKLDNVVVSFDEFKDVKKVESKNIGCSFSSGMSVLYIEPILAYNDKIVEFGLKIEADIMYRVKQVILLNERNEKVVIDISSNPIEKTYYSLMSDVKHLLYVEEISKNDYLKLTDYIKKSEQIKVAYYLANNSVIQFKNYKKRPYEVFCNVYNYYENYLLNYQSDILVDVLQFK